MRLKGKTALISGAGRGSGKRSFVSRPDESSYITGDRICCSGGRYM